MTFSLLFVALFIVSALSHTLSAPEKLVEEVNSKNVGWTAAVNPRFKWDHHEIKARLGWTGEPRGRRFPKARVDHSLAIPDQFFAATNWPKCTTINTIYDQARCGSCWAFGAAEAAADRFCIASSGTFNQALSFAQMTECNTETDGCDGGSAGAAWDFLQSPGLVSDACYPYNIPTCPPAQEPCLNFVNTPDCWANNSCANKQSWTSYRMSNVYQYSTVQDIQNGIMTKGPVEVCFDVYEDFLNYKSGVYKHTSGSYLGGHCVKVTGWGVENGTPYWMANNQWTTYWGDKGQFKIARGTDECGVEDSVFGGDPNVASFFMN